MENNMDEIIPSPAQRVFRSWEIVVKIFASLPWYEVCRLRNLSMETRYACQHCITEVGDPEIHGMTESDIYDLFIAMGPVGCRRLEKIDFRASPSLTKNMGPLLKFCENISYFGFKKDHSGHDFYFNMIYNTDVTHVAIETTEAEYVADTDIVDVMLILPHIEYLEIPGSLITDVSLSEIADENNTLRMLNVSNCLGITDIGLTEILGNCPMLTHLNVRNTPTMQRCINPILDHPSLCKLNALETELKDEDAQRIIENFENLMRPFEFTYSRAFVKNNQYNLMSVQRSSISSLSKTIHDYDSDSESIFDDAISDAVLSEFDTLDSSTVSNMTNRRTVELTATEYLSNLQQVVRDPIDLPHVIFNWAEKAFEYQEASRPKATQDRHWTSNANDDEYSKLESHGCADDLDLDVGWRQIYEVCKNIDRLKVDYDTLVQSFPVEF